MILQNNGGSLDEFHYLEPDERGINIAISYKELINYYAGLNSRATRIMVAVGIAIQSNYAGGFGDRLQEYLKLHGEVSDDYAFGIAGITENQMESMLGQSHNPIIPRDAIRGMIMRIDRVLLNDQVQKCSDMDKMIFAIFAQQNQSYDPSDVLFVDGDGQHPYFEKSNDGSYKVKWSNYFDDLVEKHASEGDVKKNTYSNIVAEGMDFQTQFMLKRAINDMRVFNDLGGL